MITIHKFLINNSHLKPKIHILGLLLTTIMPHGYPHHLIFHVHLNGFSGRRVLASPELVLTPHFLNIVVEVKSTEQPHVLKLWLGLNKDMIPVKYFYSNKSCFCVKIIFYDHMIVTTLRLATIKFLAFYWI